MPRVHLVVPRDVGKEWVPESFEGPHFPRKAPQLLNVNLLSWAPGNIPKEYVSSVVLFEAPPTSRKAPVLLNINLQTVLPQNYSKVPINSIELYEDPPTSRKAPELLTIQIQVVVPKVLGKESYSEGFAEVSISRQAPWLLPVTVEEFSISGLVIDLN